jgi:alkyl sulfatase BDS1-like metallo-beta-lactamase superfamily hydrolase
MIRLRGKGEGMKTKLVLGLLATLVIGTLMAAPALAQDFLIPSRAELDTSYPGKIPRNLDTTQLTEADAEKYPYIWWRDTTVQNKLWEYSVSQWPNPSKVLPAYVSGGAKVLVFAGQGGSNVVGIVGPQGNIVVGSAGSRHAARTAVAAYNQVVPYFQRNLRAIIYTDSNPETMWGAAEFIGIDINRTAEVKVYGNANILQAGAQRDAVSTAAVQHNLLAYGPQLPYGENGNLGAGSMFAFNPYQPDNGLVDPDNLIATETSISLIGVPMTLIPGSSADGGLWVWLPNEKVLVAGEIFGNYFPPIDGITGPEIPATEWISILEHKIGLNANVLVSLHSYPIVGAEKVAKALTDQRDALKSVHDQTVAKINQMMPLDDIVATVQIPEPLASQPFVQPYTGTVAGAVRSIYHQYMGWFDWEVGSLTTFSTSEQAEFLVGLAGGPAKALKQAYSFQQDNTLAGAQKALIISDALRKVSPSREADLTYIMSLRKLGYAEQSAHMRNYYLLLAARAEAAMQ